jgi:hypothetical protein
MPPLKSVAMGGAACDNPNSASGGRQVVAAVADEHGVRCVFFSSLGSVLDFSASCRELERAGAWWEFVARWNFWIFPTEADRLAVSRIGSVPESCAIACLPSDTVGRSDVSFMAYLDVVVRGVNGTLVRMCWQKAYCPSWGNGICKDGMDRLDDHDFLQIPTTTARETCPVPIPVQR